MRTMMTGNSKGSNDHTIRRGVGHTKFLTMDAQTGVEVRTMKRRANGQRKTDLTFRRIRSIIILILIMIVAGIGVSEAYEPVKTVSVTVGIGDTLWSIASEVNEEHHADRMDVREIIYDIQSFNHLETAMLQPGMVLEVPVN